MNIIAIRSRHPRNKGKLIGQPPATTERYLGHPSKASNCRKSSGAGSLRACDLTMLRVRDVVHGEHVSSRAM
jgi:hypothetical protein